VLFVVQLATLGAAYYVLESSKSAVLPVIILAIGAFMTWLVFILLKRSEAYRDAIKKQWLWQQFAGFDVPLKWPAVLRGGKVACVILILALLVDSVFAMAIVARWVRLFPCME